MPKTKVERNRAYRQRLRAKARAWGHVENALYVADKTYPLGARTNHEAAIVLQIVHDAIVAGLRETANG